LTASHTTFKKGAGHSYKISERKKKASVSIDLDQNKT